MNENLVLKVVTRRLLPLIMMYALYVQFHGEISPGGGFQSGIIFAAGMIAYSFVNDLAALQKIIPICAVQILSAVGVMIYAGVGVATMLMGGSFLDYSVFFMDKIVGQQFGIMLVEIGVGITVFSVIMLIFYSFGERSGDA